MIILLLFYMMETDKLSCMTGTSENEFSVEDLNRILSNKLFVTKYIIKKMFYGLLVLWGVISACFLFISNNAWRSSLG